MATKNMKTADKAEEEAKPVDGRDARAGCERPRRRSFQLSGSPPPPVRLSVGGLADLRRGRLRLGHRRAMSRRLRSVSGGVDDGRHGELLDSELLLQTLLAVYSLLWNFGVRCPLGMVDYAGLGCGCNGWGRDGPVR